MDLKGAIAAIARGTDLSGDEIREVFLQVMAGEATPAQIGALLIGLRMKGETADEIAGAARAMRERATAFRATDPENTVDTCGTGGDGSGSVNVSTIAAVVAAAAGARVAKHGNRSLSSKCGSADVLEALGVTIDAPVPVAERCLDELGIAFLFAPSYHAATKHAAGPRRELGTRTIFNLLGPLTNPAGAKNQIIGVFDPEWCQPVAEALGVLGARRVYVVHGEGGVDEIAVAGKTRIASWDREHEGVTLGVCSPADFGLEEADPAGLAGGDAAFNAKVFERTLAGESGAVRNAAVMEAAVALHACGVAADFRDGAERALAAIESGEAAGLLARWVELSGGSE